MNAASPAVELPCEEIEAMMPLIADGVISEHTDPTVFAHLARCMECQESLARHDVVSLALERGLPIEAASAQARAWRYRLPLPLAAAVAAGLLVAIGSAWVALVDTGHQHELMSRVAAMPGHGVEPARPDTEIISIPGPDPQHPRYVILQGDRTTLVDPSAAGQRRSGRTAPLVHPVGLNRY
ncbi:MAG: zf-HC2 domain-containing protein [Planctomycetes bacterium]|nr:zf-HC2 domain-containing protein [Planctomycetota bacterium]